MLIKIMNNKSSGIVNKKEAGKNMATLRKAQCPETIFRAPFLT
jgi:hypothetical protein